MDEHGDLGAGTDPGPGSSRQDPRPTRSRLPLLVAITLGAWLVDQASKWWVHEHLAGRAPVRVVGSLLQLTYARNPGAAFSTGSKFTVLISLFAVVATAIAVRYAVRVRTPGWAWGIGLVLAGITGNLTDRLFRDPGPLRGHVVDFLQLPHWPVFNVADMCINVGAVLIVLQVFRGIHVDGTLDASTRAEGAA